jgi:hypothetical protein
MGYLDTPRIHFFGKYIASPSTIDNNLSYYKLKPPLILSWNMPVTRDLAASHWKLIQTWIRLGSPRGQTDA